MQKNNITEDFDLFIKGSLQDAEEKPSPRVWQGIVAILDAAAAPAAGAFRWGWAVLAVAAAVAAVLIIPNNSNLSNKSSDRQVLAQAAVVKVADIPSPKAIAALPARQSKLAETAAPAADAKQTATEQIKAEQVPAAAEPVPAATDASATASESAASESAANAANSEKQVASQPTASQPAASQPDPFAVMAYEDSKPARRAPKPSFYLGGTMGGNESNSSGAAYAAKSSNPAYIENSIVETTASNYGIPVSLGAGVRLGLGGNFSASVGFDYTYLTRSFTGTYSPAGAVPVSGEIRQDMRYVGVPLGVYYNLISKGNVKFYLLGLGEAEWCLGNSYNIRSTGATVSEKVGGTQFSAGGGFGVDFTLGKHLSIYVDPTVRYYFDCGQPNSIRSEKPLMLNFNAGIRFNL